MAGDPGQTRASFAYDLVGYHGGGLGIAQAARNTAEALRASGRDVRLVTVGDVRAEQMPRASRSPGERGITLFEMNPLDIAALGRQWTGLIDRGAPAACIPFWELPRLPRAWLPVLRAMQVLLAPTRFVEGACREALPGTVVLHHPQAVFPPQEVRPARVEWGIAEGITAFLVAFDVGSDIERKNPWAAVTAFQAAFPPGTSGVELILKVTLRDHLPGYRAQVAELRARAADDARIRIIDRWLGYEELLRLYASCDAMISLHRSEGLGLHLMEAMSLAKPVVATGWSGNMDFMNPANAVLVGHHLVPVASHHVAYRAEVGRKGQVWAEPDPRAAADALRTLHAGPERRREIGAAAARDMERRRVEMREGRVFRDLEAIVEGTPGTPARLQRAVGRSMAHLVWRKIGEIVGRKGD